ncbi:MAG: hypothetical protein ACOCV2_14800 [Persicimonas sp.]
MTTKYEKAVTRYLERHAHEVPGAEELPAPGDELRASVVIPAYDELDAIGKVLGSLEAASERPECFEVIVVVNNADDTDDRVVERNRETIALLEGLDTPFALHVIDRSAPGRAYDAEVAGVGLARREGCDLALMRLHEAGRALDGLIPCLDGDSPVAEGYIDAALAAFDADEAMLAGVCRYRHPIPDDEEHARAICAYEGWMRYWEAALLLTGTPYAFQSIGSCMVLTARGYALADGMPTLQALSDFYVLEKVVKAGGRGAVRQLDEPMVYPSARPSGRVPRGTGPSVQMQLDSETDRFAMAEPPRVFFTLREYFSKVAEGFDDPALLLPPTGDERLDAFLEHRSAEETLQKLRDNAPTARHFERHFHTWFDNLQIVKFANATRRAEGGVWLLDAARRVYRSLGLLEAAEAVPEVGPERAEVDDWRAFLEAARAASLEVTRAPV